MHRCVNSRTLVVSFRSSLWHSILWLVSLELPSCGAFRSGKFTSSSPSEQDIFDTYGTYLTNWQILSPPPLPWMMNRCMVSRQHCVSWWDKWEEHSMCHVLYGKMSRQTVVLSVICLQFHGRLCSLQTLCLLLFCWCITLTPSSISIQYFNSRLILLEPIQSSWICVVKLL